MYFMFFFLNLYCEALLSTGWGRHSKSWWWWWWWWWWKCHFL